ncbi:TERF1-interacting nuclear factor 2 TRF1-interacting nuclear protein 2 [Collichthys lucidus]|uniref:TERF1-interacting nuclear factor 2 TRF1-interacting nuclear protein 2 n=1 Tax=Collichthys lucidus TaxID=240159 RepID=A0A4V6ATN6_COLLU|nr:TERF1-interacting nuclear factor 2 TRF1-interacting nuclear protein 2 [Collichthys lucidus]
MATGKPKDSDASLPFAALQLLAPPVRLVSAALWKVMKQRDVVQYGVVEEFVTTACETVPGLLTVRHQGKLALGLRGRLILELCRTQPDEKVIMSHLERIRAPAALSTSSAHTMKRDVKILRTVEGFHSLVIILLKDPTEREHFFKEEFPVDYGPKFDQELEKLLWEFLIRLDQLLPVPNLAQTVSWLSDAPPVLEECARAATQPQLLKILLEHQTCLGHLETAASLPPNMGDSILTSLAPSGRVPSNQPTGAAATYQSNHTHTRDETTFIKPVIGLISNENVPVMISANKKTKEKFTMLKQRQNPEDVEAKEGGEQVEEGKNASERRSGVKRKHPNRIESDSDEEEEVWGTIRSGKTRMAGLETSMNQLGVKTPKDPSLRSIFVSCLSSQPTVVIKKLSPTSSSTDRTETLIIPGDGEDYVADSEDEATKNFKGRLFMKRYYKTKHGTYVPTLREYWKPGMTRRNLPSTGSKRR